MIVAIPFMFLTMGMFAVVTNLLTKIPDGNNNSH